MVLRKIKSAPANICEMAHTKKPIVSIIQKEKKEEKLLISVLFNENQNENESNHESNHESKNHITNDITKNFKHNILNKKRIISINTALITDTYFEICKCLPDIDNYYFNGIIDIINSFISNKFNRQNLENLILSIFIRFIFSTIVHELITNYDKIKNVLLS